MCNASLTSTMAAVGPQLLDFLPLGSILNGFNSPFLISKSFRDDVYVHLSGRKIFDFSQCAHLRKITDEDLIGLMRNVVRTSLMRNPDRTLLLKLEQLDLSRCRKIQGLAVHQCLRFMPNLQRISLASCSKFDPELAGFGRTNNPNAGQMDCLRHVDLSGCSKINTHMLFILLHALKGENITHLDLSGCSSQIDDAAAGFIASYMPKVEAVNLSGAKKITMFGFGILTWICRHTLKRLNVIGCVKIDFCPLLVCEKFKIIDMLSATHDPQDASPPNMVDDYNPYIGTPEYFDDLRIATRDTSSAPVRQLRLGLSSIVWDGIKQFEIDSGITRDDHGIGLFGNLEELEMGSNKRGMEGLIAIIAWLNGGRLRKVKVTEVTTVDPSRFSINVLIETCGPRLKVLEIDSMRRNHESIPNPFQPALIRGACLCELDLSHSPELIRGDVSFLSSLCKLRSLKLDCLSFNEDGFHDYLSDANGLLRLSIQHCSSVRCSRLSAVISGNQHLKLLELDARGIDMDCPLAQLRQACKTVVRLNNRSTELGMSEIRKHTKTQMWRVGARDLTLKPAVGQKRSRSNDEHETSISTQLCSILQTGFSPKPGTEQEFFICATCNIDFGRVICSNCIKKCHSGHNTMYAGFNRGYCDCCIFSECQCLGL